MGGPISLTAACVSNDLQRLTTEAGPRRTSPGEHHGGPLLLLLVAEVDGCQAPRVTVGNEASTKALMLMP